MSKVHNMNADASGMAEEVTRIGYRMWKLLRRCGYSVRFISMGCDKPGDYAFFVIDASSLPKVALRLLRTPQQITLMEKALRRDVAVLNNQGKVTYIVPLRAEPELAPETA